MKIDRRFTKSGQNVYDAIEWAKRSSKISNLDGSVVFEMKDAEVPASWSQLATDIMVSKYFRKAGVPQPPEGVDPIKAQQEGNLQRDEHGKVVMGPEKSARQVIHRLAGCWRQWGEDHGYFDSAEDAQAFYDELAYMMLNQMCAPNSPQWFNTGLYYAYGINGPSQGHYYTDPITGETKPSEDSYSHPQPHACFIQSVKDDLVNSGGIMDLWVREARLFKYGSGTGTNFSDVRGENESLSGGGKSSGLMSWLKIGDRAAGAIKSGGTTRRAAKMVCLDLDHPDIEKFINWKVREEIKVAALVEGFRVIAKQRAADADPETIGETAKRLGLELNYDFNGEAYYTVSGQNSNNSVRIPNEFFTALDDDSDWDLRNRIDGKVSRTVAARELWAQIGYAAWRCADPGVQYDGTINQWHTCPGSGRINASNPCSEYMFLDNTACNLASLNLLKFYNSQTKVFDAEGYEHGIRLWTVVLEISVLMAQYPSKEIARLSYEYRTLGLGYANLGAMLMQAGIPYDSERARSIAGCLTSILTGRSYATSAQMSKELGPFAGYFKNREDMLRVIRNHRRAAYGVPRDDKAASAFDFTNYEGLTIKPVPIDAAAIDSDAEPFGKLGNSREVLTRARACWDDALKLGEAHGYRNAQTTVIAPTGTIGLLMDCDTTGVEPDFALVKFKKLAGGGYFKIANQSLRPSLVSLGYTEEQVKDILTYVMGTLHVDVAVPEDETTAAAASTGQTLRELLSAKGMPKNAIAKAVDSLPTVFELQHAFSLWTLGEETLKAMCLEAQASDPSFNLLRAVGLSNNQIKALGKIICGTQTVEGAPHLKEEHLAVFDCANKCGPFSKRFIHQHGHIRMMAAAQPFISGAISKTINLPNEATVADIQESYRLSWELGLKANALYRDGCKLSQPLNTSANDDATDDGVEDEEAIEAALGEVSAEVVEVAAAAALNDAGDFPGERVRTIEKIVERVVERPLRRRLPDTRMSRTHKFNVAGHEGYLTVGLYEDGTPGELFITMAKEGSTIGGLMDSLGTAISVALQYGVPTESLVTKFTHQRFEPAGMTHNREIPFAKSLVDYIFRWMGMEFVSGYREANAPKRSEPKKLAEPAREPVVLSDSPRVEALHSHEQGNGNGRSRLASDRITIVNADAGQLKPVKGGGQSPRHEGGTATATQTVAERQSALDEAMGAMQADAPACDVCGTITVRNGTCYKCMNCGNSMGCS